MSTHHRRRSLGFVSVMLPLHRYNMKIACLGALLLGAQIGCFDAPGTIKQLQQEADQHRLELEACQRSASQRESQIAELEKQIENQPRLAQVGLGDLFVADRIKILSRSGGVDLDGQPGDDGVVVYVQPVDADGDVIKAAGATSIQLTDLTQLGSPQVIATFDFSTTEAIRKHWYGGFLTNHYSFKCPFPDTMAAIPSEVHVRVVFLDWLTGREFTESATAKIEVRPTGGPE